MTSPTVVGCLVCGSKRWVVLPEIGPPSMASDWRVLPVPLRKRICPDCGLVSNMAPPPAGLFEGDYALYAHAGSAAFREQRRQQLYARWIADALERAGQSTPPHSVLDVGCGNASLLLALGEQWPSTTLMGCDPSAEAVAHANAAGCRVWQGTSSSLAINLQAELVVSVNVIEHTGDPLAFLQDLRRGMARDGTLVLICPDGARPSVELLMADHAYSFASSHLRRILAGAELAIGHIESAPPELGSFQMVIAGSRRASPAGAVRASALDAGRVRAYLERWAALDGLPLSRLGDGGVSCFGVGEAAGLLRAYLRERGNGSARARPMSSRGRHDSGWFRPYRSINLPATSRCCWVCGHRISPGWPNDSRRDSPASSRGTISSRHHAVQERPTAAAYGIREREQDGDALAFHSERIRAVGYSVLDSGISPQDVDRLGTSLDAILDRQVQKFGGLDRLLRIGDATPLAARLCTTTGSSSSCGIHCYRGSAAACLASTSS